MYESEKAETKNANLKLFGLFILVLMVLFLNGCSMGFAAPGQPPGFLDLVTAAVSTIPGYGQIIGLLMPGAWSAWRHYKTKKDFKGSIHELAGDTYKQYENMTESERKRMNATVRNALPKKWRGYYDKAEHIANKKNLLI